MLRDIREYAQLGVGLLLTLKNFLVTLPRNAIQLFKRFLAWFTGDYDAGYIVLDIWMLWTTYLFIGILRKYTNVIGNTLDCFWFFFEIFYTMVSIIFWIFYNYWIPIFVLLLLGMGTAHFYYKKHREMHEMMWSYVDDEEDIPVNICDIRPQPLNCRGWGARDEDIEPVANFVAPTKYIKISGMVGMVPGMTIPDNIVRMNQSLKEKLAPGAINGPYPWVKVTVDTRVALVYVKFKTIEDATNCFNTLDGYSFDGKFNVRN